MCDGTLQTLKFNIVSINCSEVMRGTAHFRLMKIIIGEVKSTIVNHDTADSQIMISDYINVLRVE